MSPLRIERLPNVPTTYRLTCSQQVDRPIDEVFAYFAAARNLEQLTPSWMQFSVATPEPINMRSGLLIDYRLKVHGFPLNWQSEITDWEPPVRFVDEQRKGPYRLWHHEHTFVEREGGTLVCDRVDYSVPGGRFVHQLFVKRDLEAIFQFRSQKLTEIFPARPESVTSSSC